MALARAEALIGNARCFDERAAMDRP
jgi:hypothetical protein